MTIKFLPTALLSLCLVGTASSLQAAGQTRGHSSSSGSGTAGRAVPRSVSPTVGPGRGIARPGYPYHYGPRFGLSFYGGYPYGYNPYGYYGLGYGYGYPYAYGYPYGYDYPYGYGYPAGYASAGYAGNSYGGVRITDAPEDAAVYADGYYVGTVGDFNGTFQHINLEPGAHHIEIVKQGDQTTAVDVNVRPGQTITYRAK